MRRARLVARLARVARLAYLTLVALLAMALRGADARADDKEIVVGSKRFTESYLLGEAAFRAAGGKGHAP